jgi:hypothetical protein
MPARRCAALILGLAALISAHCSRGVFRQYEYEEEIYLKLDGSAEVVVNTSIPALVALRGAALDVDPDQRVDRTKVRAFFDSPAARVTSVSRPWRRSGRRFVQVRLRTDDVRRLSTASPFAWSSYRFAKQRNAVIYQQQIGRPSGGASPASNAWNGTEIVAVRLHVPSRITFHNATTRVVERGNILSWEQPLKERLGGRPLDVQVRMEAESILARTLTIFGISAAAALVLLASFVLWFKRKGAVQS